MNFVDPPQHDMRALFRKAILLLLLMHLASPTARAQATGPDASLRGLSAFTILVNAQAPLDGEAIRAIAEDELKGAGLATLRPEEYGGRSDAAALIVSILLIRVPDAPLYGGHTLVQVFQRAVLSRSADTSGFYVTWQNGGPWVAGEDKLQSLVERDLRAEIAQFLSDLRAVNPVAR